MKRQYWTGTHPAGRTAAIKEHDNDFCEWQVFKHDGTVFISGTAPSIDSAKAEVRKHAYSPEDLIDHRVNKSDRWKWESRENA